MSKPPETWESVLIGFSLCLIAAILISWGVATQQNRVLERARFINNERNEMLDKEVVYVFRVESMVSVKAPIDFDPDKLINEGIVKWYLSQDVEDDKINFELQGVFDEDSE